MLAYAGEDTPEQLATFREIAGRDPMGDRCCVAQDTMPTRPRVPALFTGLQLEDVGSALAGTA